MKSTPENRKNKKAIALYLETLKNHVTPQIFEVVKKHAQIEVFGTCIWILFHSELMVKAMSSNLGFQAAAIACGVQVKFDVIQNEDDRIEDKIMDDLEAELAALDKVKPDFTSQLAELLKSDGIQEITLTIVGANRVEAHSVWVKRRSILKLLTPAGRHPELMSSKIRLNVHTPARDGKSCLYDSGTVARPN